MSNTEFDNTEVLIHDNMNTDDIPKLSALSFGTLQVRQSEINRERDHAMKLATELAHHVDNLHGRIGKNEWQKASESLKHCRALVAQLEAIK